MTEKRKILSYFLPGGDEKASVWKYLFNDLKRRGLKGVKIIVSDDLKGLSNAIRETFPNVEHQLCWFHLKKNIKNRVRKRHWNIILNELNNIMESKDEKEGEEKLYAFIEKWGGTCHINLSGYQNARQILFFKEKDTKYMSRRLRYADILKESLERF